MDVVTYALLNGKVKSLSTRVDNVTLAYTYKGSVASVDDLPDDAETGDLYTVGSVQYVWDGTEWITPGAGVPITDAQIDAIVE